MRSIQKVVSNVMFMKSSVLMGVASVLFKVLSLRLYYTYPSVAVSTLHNWCQVTCYVILPWPEIFFLPFDGILILGKNRRVV